MGKNGHKVRIGKLSEFRSQSLNANKHTERGLGLLDTAMSEDGYVAPMTAVADGEIIDGSARLERACEQFSNEAIVVEHDGTRPIIAKRIDIPNADNPLARRISLRANRIAELDLDWNAEILQSVEPETLNGMFSDRELSELLSQIKTEPQDTEPQIDKAEELRQKWGTETGQLWVIGNHRLLVGDATNKADVGRVCANVRPSLMVTDPPYGVDYDPTWRDDKGAFGIGKVTMRGKVENDERADWVEAYRYSPSDVVYVWHASRHCVTVNQNLIDADYEVRAQIIWRKQHFAMSRGDYHWQHEPLFYAVRKGKKSGWIGGRTQSTIWDINNANPSGHSDSPEIKLGHGTQKPLECMARPIRNHSGDVYDPFVGSGTTLVAAENLNRKCYAIEISPAYVAVCLERMKTVFPHLEIQKHEA